MTLHTYRIQVNGYNISVCSVNAILEDNPSFFFRFEPIFHGISDVGDLLFQVLEFQQRKCCVIFDLSCNLARLLEFCTHVIPQAFLSGPDTNLRRLTELIVFILNYITSASDVEFFDL